EDGIRDFHVTGVQTCALPISISVVIFLTFPPILLYRFVLKKIHPLYSLLLLICPAIIYVFGNMLVNRGKKLNLEGLTSRMAQGRSEERRVGKECRSRRSKYH